MKNLFISLIASIFFLLVSGCSDQAKKQPASASPSQGQESSGMETSTVGSDSAHVSGTSSPSSSNISGN